MSFARQLRRYAIELGAVLVLVVCASRGRRLRAGPPARALPVAARLHDQGGASRRRAGGHARPGADRRRRRRQGRRDRQGQLHDGPRAWSSWRSSRDKLPAVYANARAAAAPEDRAAGHVDRRSTPARRTRAKLLHERRRAAGRADAAGRQPRRGARRRSTPTRARYLRSSIQRRRPRARRAAAATCARCSRRARRRCSRTPAADRRRSPTGGAKVRAAGPQPARCCSERGGRARTTSSRALVSDGAATFSATRPP